MSDHVFVEEKPMAGKEHPLQPGAVIGREGCEINLADPEVSRRHAAIRVDSSGPAIEDLGSTNGTFVNDQRIQGLRPLSEGDTVRFGNTVWRLQAAAGAGRAAAAPAGEPTLAQPAAGPPQVTAAQPAPPAPPQPAPASPPQPAPASPPQPASPAPPAPAQPAVPAAQQRPEAAPNAQQVAASVGAPDQRGDVPRPPDVAPSAIRRVLPPPGQGQAAAFNPSASTTVRGSAATRIGPTIFAFVVTALTAAGVILYLVLYEP